MASYSYRGPSLHYLSLSADAVKEWPEALVLVGLVVNIDV